MDLMATSQLISMTVTALFYCKEYDDSNPDVGMGPSLEMLLDRVLKSSGVKLSKSEKELVLTRYKMKYHVHADDVEDDDDDDPEDG